MTPITMAVINSFAAIGSKIGMGMLSPLNENDKHS